MRWAVVAALGVGLACEGMPDVSEEGRHVRLAMDDGLVPCGGTVEHMDRFIELLSAEFDVPPPTGDQRLMYYWLEREGFGVRTVCPDGVIGCSFVASAWVKSIPVNHELVHAVAWPIGSPRPFFIEGLATAYAGLGDSSQLWRNRRWGPVEHSLMVGLPREVDYSTAGGFVGYVIEEHGIAAFLRFYAKLPLLATRGQVERKFADEFGVSLASSIAAFERDRPCEQTVATQMLVECAASAIAWDGVRFTEYRELACEQEDVVGPYDGSSAVVFRTLEVMEEGEYEVTMIGENITGRSAGASLYMVSCGACAERESLVVKAGEGAVRLKLASGVYSLRLVGQAREVTSVGWLIERVP